MKKYLLMFAAIVMFASSAIAQDDVAINTGKNRSGIFHYSGGVNFLFATGSKASLSSYRLTYGNWYKAKSDLTRLGVETIHGLGISKYAFIGAGIGFQYYLGNMLTEADKPMAWKTLAMPIFADLKGMYTFGDKYTPYITLGLGYTAILTSADTDKGLIAFGEEYFSGSSKLKGGFYCDFGVGIKIERFNIGVGLQHQKFSEIVNFDSPVIYEGHYLYNVITDMKFNSFYIKVGVYF